MARPDKRTSSAAEIGSSRVTPKGGTSAAPQARSTSQRRTSRAALVLVVLIILGLVAGTIGLAVGGGSTTVQTVPAAPS